MIHIHYSEKHVTVSAKTLEKVQSKIISTVTENGQVNPRAGNLVNSKIEYFQKNYFQHAATLVYTGKKLKHAAVLEGATTTDKLVHLFSLAWLRTDLNGYPGRKTLEGRPVPINPELVAAKHIWAEGPIESVEKKIATKRREITTLNRGVKSNSLETDFSICETQQKRIKEKDAELRTLNAYKSRLEVLQAIQDASERWTKSTVYILTGDNVSSQPVKYTDARKYLLARIERDRKEEEAEIAAERASNSY